MCAVRVEFNMDRHQAMRCDDIEMDNIALETQLERMSARPHTRT